MAKKVKNVTLGSFFHGAEAEDVDMLDQVIAFDTTGSMGNYIEDVRRHVTELIPTLFSENKNLRIKIVAFGDYCDMRGPNDFGKAYQEIELTDDQQALINFVRTASNTGGGDTDEFYELVIHKITNETKWREGSRRTVLFIGDCGPHPVGYSYGNIIKHNQIDWKDEVGKSVGLGIKWDTLSCGNSAKYFYEEMSRMSDGVHIPFQTSHKMSEVTAATVRSRGVSGSAGVSAFMTSYSMASLAGDVEMERSYEALSKNLSRKDKADFDSLSKKLKEDKLTKTKK